MSQVATETAASTSDLMSQRVHPLERTGTRNADSSLQLKTLGLPTSQATPTAAAPHTQQEPQDRVRRSRRLVEKSTRLKKHSSTQRSSSRHKHHHIHHHTHHHTGQSSHTSHPSSTSHSSTTAPAPPPTDAITTSSAERAPQSRSNNNTSSSSTSTLARAQATSPVQLEHSYALTFSSTAEEISYDNHPLTGIHETPPTTTPTSSSSQTTSIPVSVIQTSPSRSDNLVPRDHGRRRRHGLHDRSARRDLTVPGSSVDLTFNTTSSLPPYMLSSSTNYPIAAVPGHIFSHTEHAQNQSGRDVPSIEHARNQSGRGVSSSEHTHNHVHTHVHVHEESVNDSSVQGVPFHVPIAMPYSHYSTAGSEVHTEIVSSRAEETERERERLEHSTAFIAALSRERSTNARRRGRRRRHRSGERNEVEETSLSSSSSGHNARDRSPHSTNHSSPLTTTQRPPRRRRTARPAPQSNTSVPLSAVRVSSVRSTSHLPPLSLGFQMVPQVSVGVASSSSSGAPGPYSNALHRREVQGLTSHGLGGSTSQPIFHEVPPHSYFPFHPPSYYTRGNGSGDSGSHSSGESGSHSTSPLDNVRVPPLIHVHEGGATFGDGSSMLDQAVPRAVRTESSNSDVIIVDSSDSEDDVVIVSHVTPRTNQITTDEEFARRLQDQFDREMDDHVTVFPPPTSGPSHLPRPPLTRPPLNQSGGSLIRDNYEALLSHIHSLSVPDMTRLLDITRTHARRRTGRNPRSQAEFARAMESMGEILLVNALFRAPVVSGTSYEDLLELAETLGPARPQGLPQEVIDNLPLREFTSSMDSSTPGEQPKCVVCMCDFEERDSLRTLPCVHEFHKNCIDQWLKDHRTCPICRVELTIPS